MRTKKAKKWTTIRVDEDTFAKLKSVAKHRKESLSFLIASLINK